MKALRVRVEIENVTIPGRRAGFDGVFVDTESALSWIPTESLNEIGITKCQRRAFRKVSGTIVERWTGPAVVYAAGTSTVDDIVFAEPDDAILLGARTLSGLNIRFDPVAQRLVDAGPAAAAAAA